VAQPSASGIISWVAASIESRRAKILLEDQGDNIMADKREKGRRQRRAGAQDSANRTEEPGLPKGLGRSIKPDAQGAFKATHTVTAGETLSQIALQYYGSAGKEDWMAIYEANKATIGDNPSLIRPGQELKIPER
jgi:nucleoid-associated protein YgaU